MPTDIDLIFQEETGSVASLLSALAFIISGLLALQVSRAKDKGINLTTTPTSSQYVLKGAQLGLLSNAIILLAAILRFQQRSQRLETGEETGTLIPNKWIIIGGVFAVIGSISFVTGASARIAEEGQVTII